MPELKKPEWQLIPFAGDKFLEEVAARENIVTSYHPQNGWKFIKS